jgi:hypothetical protein
LISAVSTAWLAVGISAQPSLSGGFESGACDDGGPASLAGGDESDGLLSACESGADAFADAGEESGGVLAGAGVDAGGGELSGAGEDAGGVCEPSAAGVGVDAAFAPVPDCDDGGESSSPGLDAGGVPPGGWFPGLLMSPHHQSRTR